MSRRRAVALVARREVTERVRQRSFQVSTALTLLLVAVASVLPGVLGGSDDEPERYRVGADDAASQRVVAAASGQRISVRRVTDRAAADRGLRDETLDAAVLGGRTLLSLDGAPPELESALRAAASRAGSAAALRERGVAPEAIERALSPPPLAERTLEDSGDEQERTLVAFAAALLLYLQLLTYGLWVASGVVEEKASRVVEILLATIRPRELLAGKIAGLGLIGLAQLLLVVAVGVSLALVTGTLELGSSVLGAVGVVLLWFPLGYLLYASLYAAAGALVSRQEDLNSVSGPLTIVIVLAYIVSFQAAEDPGGTLARVAAIVPFTAPIVEPVRIVAGEGSLASSAIAVATTALAALVAVRIGARVYERAVLRTGKPVGLREALSSPAR